MKIDFNYKFKSLDGKDIKEQGSNLRLEQLLSIKTWEEFEAFKNDLKKGKPFTLRTASVNVLLMNEEGGNGRQKGMSGEEKVKRYDLAMKIHKSDGLLDLQSEEIALLKKLIAGVYPPLTTAQSWQILDPHEAEDKK